MSVDYFLVDYNDKLIFYLGKNLIEEDIEFYAKEIKKIDEETENPLYKELEYFTLKDIFNLLFLAKKGEILYYLIQIPGIMLYYYFKYILNKKVEIISEYDLKGKIKNWKIIDVNW